MPISVSLSAASSSVRLRHYWSTCVGAGRAHEGLRANWLEQLAFAVNQCGFRYIRFHGLFHDDMCVYREVDGQPIYNWQYVDELFDRLLAIGIRPFVEFGFFPEAIAAPKSKTQFWWEGRITPPSSFEKWARLIDQIVRHWLDRYGLEEVREWYFEVWNEPNLCHAFWDGTRAQYFEMYRVTAQVLKRIDLVLRVGGPATSNFVPDDRFDGEREDLSRHTTSTMASLAEGEWRGPWIEAFLEFCAAEKLPVDFVSSHPYPTDFPLDEGGHYVERTRPVEATKTDLQWLRRTISASAFPEAEIHLTEWSSSPSPRDHSHDSLPAATYVVKTNIEASGLVDSLAYWTFTDVFEEGGAGDTIFHGGFGLLNFQGLAKPTFHAYRFLNQLGDVEIARGDGFIVTRKTGEQSPRILIWHYPAEIKDSILLTKSPEAADRIRQSGSSTRISISLKNLAPHQALLVEVLDSENGFVLPAWKEMGSPEPPTREQAARLREASFRTGRKTLTADPNGTLEWEGEMAPWAVWLIREAGSQVT